MAFRGKARINATSLPAREETGKLLVGQFKADFENMRDPTHDDEY